MATVDHTTCMAARPRFSTDVRQAIETRFSAPTNHRGSRITVRCLARSMTVNWDHALGVEANHRAAAMTLVERLGWIGTGWGGTWHQGGDTSGDGYVFVFAATTDDARAHAATYRAAYLSAFKYHFHKMLVEWGGPVPEVMRRRFWRIAKMEAERYARTWVRLERREIVV
jgi:hypothetical protein